MDKTTPNIGQSGEESIRFDGMKVGDIPLGMGNQAKEGLPAFRKTERQTKVSNIVAKYPKQSVAYLEGAIKECKGNVTRITDLAKDHQQKISEYASQLSLCDHRDSEIAKIADDDPDKKDKIKDLRLKFPPYDPEAMQQQIQQFEEGIQRCNDVIAQENSSIAEFSTVLGLAKQRDMELKNLVESIG